MNPVKLAWSNTKNNVHKNNMVGLKWLTVLTAEGVVTMTERLERLLLACGRLNNSTRKGMGLLLT
jgi:hypothetical protein